MADLDPAQKQEDAPEDVNTVAVPQAKEEVAESPEESGEGAVAPQDEKPAEDAQPDAIDILVDGIEPPAQAEEAPVSAIKALRKRHKEQAEEIAELKRQLAAQAPPAKADVPDQKPTFESCGFDAAVFEDKLQKWNEAEAAKKAEAAKAQSAWSARVDLYVKGKEQLSKQVPDFADAEKLVESTLDGAQQSAIVAYAKNPALVVCALGRNPKLLEDLAKEKNPTRFAVEVASLEARVKTPKKTPTPPPDKPVRGSGAPSGTADQQLERARAKAEESGDYTEVHRLKRQRAQR